MDENHENMILACKRCNFTSSTLEEIAVHQRNIHALDRKFIFFCPMFCCQHHGFLSYEALRVHISNCHRQGRGHQRTLPAGHLSCPFVNCPVSVGCQRDLCYHLMKSHGAVGELIPCPFQSCDNGPFKLGSFRTHLSTHHSGWRDMKNDVGDSCDPLPMEVDTLNATYSDDNIANDDEVVHDSDYNDYDDGEEEIPESINFFHQIAKFYLKMEAELGLAASTVQTMSEGLYHLLQLNMGIMKKRIMKELGDLGLKEREKDRILTEILSSDKLYCAHDKQAPGPTLSTSALRKSYYAKNFCLVEHDEINISQDPDDRRCVYLFDIERTLEVLVECPSIQHQIDESFQDPGRNDGLLNDYRDGQVYKRSQSSQQKSIDLILFQDSFNPLKDLSSVGDEYDTLGVYFTLGNLKPNVRSRLQSIHLAMLAPKFKKMWSDFRTKMFNRLIFVLKKLETEGISYKGEKVPVIVQFIVGDNKGQNQIGGFVESFTALNYCRFCPMTKQEMQDTPWEVLPLRSKEQNREDLLAFLDQKEHGNIKHVNGVSGTCPFDVLTNFESSDPRFCPCLAHDIFEGLADKYDFREMLQHFIDEEWFSLKTLNKLISKFEYSTQDNRNKPSKVKASKIGGHAVQNWTLLRLLPLILGKQRILDTEDLHWQQYLKLKEISEYVCAPSHSLEQIADLKILIQDYLHDRMILLFGRILPKHHFLAHYADLIYLLGPLIHLFTLRFESMHKFFKQCARTSKNVINIGHTMSEKAALYFAYLSTGLFINEEVISKNEVPLRPEIYSEAMQTVIGQESFSPSAQQVESITIDGLTYSEGQWLLLGNDANTSGIIIGNIKCIIVDNNIVRVVLLHHLTKFWAEYGLHTIQDETLNKFSCVDPKKMKYPVPQSVYYFDGQPVVSLKHSLSVVAC